MQTKMIIALQRSPNFYLNTAYLIYVYTYIHMYTYCDYIHTYMYRINLIVKLKPLIDR